MRVEICLSMSKWYMLKSACACGDLHDCCSHLSNLNKQRVKSCMLHQLVQLEKFSFAVFWAAPSDSTLKAIFIDTHLLCHLQWFELNGTTLKALRSYLIIMYIYHVLINALSAHMIHINLNNLSKVQACMCWIQFLTKFTGAVVADNDHWCSKDYHHLSGQAKSMDKMNCNLSCVVLHPIVAFLSQDCKQAVFWDKAFWNKVKVSNRFSGRWLIFHLCGRKIKFIWCDFQMPNFLSWWPLGTGVWTANRPLNHVYLSNHGNDKKLICLDYIQISKQSGCTICCWAFWLTPLGPWPMFRKGACSQTPNGEAHWA